MMNKILGLALSSVAAMAMAQAPSAMIIRGEGAAQDANQHRITFHIDGKKLAVPGHDPRVEGGFSAQLIGENNRPVGEVILRGARELNVADHHGMMAGPGVWVHPGPNGPVRTEGRVELMVADLRDPQHPGNGDARDHIAFRVVRPGTNGNPPTVLFAFEGAVGRGDIACLIRNGDGGGHTSDPVGKPAEPPRGRP